VEQKALVAEDSDTKRLTRKQELTTSYGVSNNGKVLENGYDLRVREEVQEMATRVRVGAEFQGEPVLAHDG
jgi:hypothetical protein